MNSRKHLFISHHSKDDAELTKLTNLLSKNGYDIRNSSMRLKARNEKRLREGRVSTEVIKRLLRMKISWASTVVVLIGKETHSRPWVNWEIDKANEQGKRIIGIFARGATEADIPQSFENYGSSLVAWNAGNIIRALEGENNFQDSNGIERPKSTSATSVEC